MIEVVHALSGEGRRVLIVEDDANTRELLRRTLEDVGWQADEAENGVVGLERIRENAPDLILLDLMMPVMDGFEFLMEMSTHSEWQDIPVIVITAKDLTEEDRRLLGGRVERVLEKGAYSREQLMQLIRTAVTAG